MEMHALDAAALPDWPRHPDPVSGVLCGVAAGAAYLVAQMLFAGAMAGGSVWEPMQRIAAILLGPNAAPPAPMSLTEGGIGLLIHFGLAMVFGRMVERVVRGCAPLGAAARGAAVGALFYLVNFWLIAPSSFPWFADSPALVTLADHLLFGAVAGVACQHIRRLRPAPVAGSA